jgi:hypothetical protein
LRVVRSARSGDTKTRRPNSGEIDPADPHNAIITDVDFAPRNARGKLEYETDIMILRPVDRSAGNHKLWARADKSRRDPGISADQ